MARSTTDATRFTSTTPHAATKPKPASRNPGPPGETPQQRVKRLRAAADKARDAQISTFDKFLMKGRVWADKAHRFTAFSLIGLTCMVPPHSFLVSIGNPMLLFLALDDLGVVWQFGNRTYAN